MKCKKVEQNVKSTLGKEKSVMKGSITTQNMISQCRKGSDEVMVYDVWTQNKLVTTKPWFSKSQMVNEHELL